jgi:hypothetical protein
VPRATEAAATHVHRKSPPGRRALVAGCWRSGWELGPGLGCVQDAPSTTGGEEGAAARLVEWRCRRAATPSTTATGEANQERRRHGFEFGHERRRACLRPDRMGLPHRGRPTEEVPAGVPATRWDGTTSLRMTNRGGTDAHDHDGKA